MVDPNGVAVGDFVEAPADATVQAGVYRVVGTPGDALVCLRVTDENGRRTHTGDLVRVGADAASDLVPASAPRRTVVGFLKNQIEGPYWMVRSLLPF
ncbi:hypothetical protein G9C85_04340 [Halorubellus sp. JP-L1]|uniref:hypothetical protein n=1 Tax=Halorubellus sp. JP-L1 TaxID=2715753 RepID=UPI001407385E|nr:hypothetical protein [Halorubellus sp. JP-L1]NHN40863.1 hypothetical protein [Halorubellus sp. JP-L1]